METFLGLSLGALLLSGAAWLASLAYEQVSSTYWQNGPSCRALREYREDNSASDGSPFA